ncbi:hypothetical protein [Dyella sp. ASV21]|uniref:hypothetical protein n=1 Tax=Dyella sp. ASV21 TaxID=2795114 RepID=UPI0018EAAE89|nr:hypothetical protein [Dyella sp. ASV21]
MSHQLMTVADLKQALPKGLQHQANQEFADKVNSIVADPEAAEEVRNNFLTYAKVLQDGKYKTEDYLNAVTYCTFKIMGYTNKDAYAKTFEDRYKTLVLRGASDKDISAYVAAYHKNKLVNQILEQATIPTWLLNQDVFQKAINTQLELMTSAQSEKVRTDAANSLLTHLKPPETKKVELDVSVKNQGGIADLMATMEQLAQTQLSLIQGGANAREVGRTPLLIEGEVRDVTAVPAVYSGPPAQAVALPHVGPPAQAVPLPHVMQSTCVHGVDTRFPCEVCSKIPAQKPSLFPATTAAPAVVTTQPVGCTSCFGSGTTITGQPCVCGLAPAARPSMFSVPAPDPEPAAPENSSPFAGLEDLRTGGDFEYREDVVQPKQQTVALSLFDGDWA